MDSTKKMINIIYARKDISDSHVASTLKPKKMDLKVEFLFSSDANVSMIFGTHHEVDA